MTIERVLSALGLGELLAEDFFALQIGALGLTALFFLCALALCLLAFRAAGAARRAQNEAAEHYRAAQDLAAEVRHLTAQIERSATGRPGAAASVPAAPVRVGAAETTAEADIDIVREPGGDAPSADIEQGAPDHRGPHDADRTLDEAKKAATVPSALLSGLLRRRT